MFKSALKYVTRVGHDMGHDIFVSRYLRMLAFFCMLLFIASLTLMTLKHNLDKLRTSGYSNEQRPLTSMVFVKRINTLKFLTCIDNQIDGNACAPLKDDTMAMIMSQIMSSEFSHAIAGSAAVISHDISRNSSYVLTAYHVCNNTKEKYASIEVPVPTPHTMLFTVESKIVLTDFFGNRYSAQEMRVDPDNDLCIMQTDKIMEQSTPVRIAKVAPVPGDRIYNIASPRSLSQPGAVLSYDGYFAGTVDKNVAIKNPHYLFAIPTAPGSSGSIVLNERGEIISVISYGFLQDSVGPVPFPPHEMWPLASSGPTLESIQKLIAPTFIQ